MTPTRVTAGQGAVFDADVAMQDGNSGTVSFFADGVLIGKAQVSALSQSSPALGRATLERNLPAGLHSISAEFVSESGQKGARSAAVQLQVDDPERLLLTISAGTTSGDSVQYALVSNSDSIPAGSVQLQTSADGKVIAAGQVSGVAPAAGIAGTSLYPGQKPLSFCLGDFDGNGFDDLAVVDGATSAVAILLADQNGEHFYAAPPISIPGVAEAVVSADFNQDGIPDLAVMDSSLGAISIFFGDPDHRGQFVALGEPIRLSPGLVSIITTDVNQDGEPDLVVLNFLENTVTVLTNDASDPGQFNVGQQIQLTGGISAVGSGDLFGNGLHDLAVAAYQDGTVWLLRNDPAHIGSFISPQLVTKVGAGPSAIALGDLNGDGIPDIAVCNSLDSTTSVFFAQQQARGEFLTQTIIPLGAGCSALSVTDAVPLNQLVIADSTDGELRRFQISAGALRESSSLSVGASVSDVAMLPGRATLVSSDPTAGVIRTTTPEWSITGAFPPIPSSFPLPLDVRAWFDDDSAVPIPSNPLHLSGPGLQPQQISFDAPATATYGDQVVLQAASSSGLPVALRVISGPATISESTLNAIGTGSVVVEASQPGDSSFSPAVTVQRTIEIDRASLEASANPATMVQGQQPPTFTGTMTGVKNGDPIGLTFVSQADTATPAGEYDQGPYAITPVLLDPSGRLNNYNVVANTAALVVVASTSPEPVSSADEGSATTALTAGSYPTPAQPSGATTPPASTTTIPVVDPPVATDPVQPIPTGTTAPSSDANTGTVTTNPPSTGNDSGQLGALSVSTSSVPSTNSGTAVWTMNPGASAPGSVSADSGSNSTTPPPISDPSGSPTVPPSSSTPGAASPSWPSPPPSGSQSTPTGAGNSGGTTTQSATVVSPSMPSVPIGMVPIPIPLFNPRHLFGMSSKKESGSVSLTGAIDGSQHLHLMVELHSLKDANGRIEVLENGSTTKTLPLSGVSTYEIDFDSPSVGTHEYVAKYVGASGKTPIESDRLLVLIAARNDNTGQPSTAQPSTASDLTNTVIRTAATESSIPTAVLLQPSSSDACFGFGWPVPVMLEPELLAAVAGISNCHISAAEYPDIPVFNTESQADVFFDQNSYVLSASSNDVVARFGNDVAVPQRGTIEIDAYAGDEGSSEYSLALSEARAASVRSGLVRAGVDQSRISTVSYGAEQTLCENRDQFCRNSRPLVHVRLSGADNQAVEPQ